MHDWIEDEDLLALYLYRFCNRRGIPPGSLGRRIANFQYLMEGQGGLRNASQKSRNVYAKYKGYSYESLRESVVRFFQRT